MYTPNKTFYDTVRPLFGKLTVEQVQAMDRIVVYLLASAVPKAHAAYILATIFHETAAWMQPIREGARRYGPAYTDAQSRNAVGVLYAKGLIRKNYALPHPETGHSYYGRGLVQITHASNYLKLSLALGVDLYDNPDLALDWDTALAITVVGMQQGLFTGISLNVLDPENPQYVKGRQIINGDTKKYGKDISDFADVFFAALDGYNRL